MIFLRDLLFENTDDEIDANTWSNWIEYLKYHRFDIPKEEILKLKNKFQLDTKQLLKTIFEISDINKTEYIIYNIIDETFEYIKDIQDWLYSLSDHQMEELLDHNVDIIYNSWIESTLEDVKKFPGKVYHYTNEENWEMIQQSGKLVGSYGTGITNRSVYGIFTSINPEEYADGTYGDICLEIDLETFKQETNLQEVNISYEPDVEEYLLRELIASKLKIENINLEIPRDMSCYTLIINHEIPIKYIKYINQI